ALRDERATPRSSPVTVATAPPADGQHADAEPTPRLVLLGPAELVGSRGGTPRPKVLEALCYLGAHPRGVTTDRLATALWPTKAPSQKTIHNLIGEARRYLPAVTADANPLTQHGPRWVLDVDTDVAAFDARVD